MRVIKVYRHGFTMGTPPATSTHKRAERSTVSGWSVGATRRNVAFLRSIDETKVNSHDGAELIPLAITLTVRDCPQTSDEFHRVRDLFIRRLKRLGMVRMHWVIEWQRRGVPHLHCAVWFKQQDFVELNLSIINGWLELTEQWGSGHRGQFITPITGVVGWFQYVSKHAARGVKHYQRSPENMPVEWNNKTGRVWGKVGDWDSVIVPGGRVDVESSDYYRIRRLIRNWRLADSRSKGSSYSPKRIVQARTMLKCNLKSASEVRGASEWVNERTMVALCMWVLANPSDS